MSKTKVTIIPKEGSSVFIGDISYVMSEETNSNWESHEYADGPFAFKDLHYGAFSTAYGDGQYSSSLGDYSVDTGTIGFIESGLFSDDYAKSIHLGLLVEDAEKINFEVSDGYFEISIFYRNGEKVHYDIETGDEEFEDFDEDQF